MNSAKLDFELRQEFGNQDDKVDEPDVENTYGSYGDFQLVGKGKVTNDYCGKYYGFVGCVNVHLHNKITLDGKNYKGKVFVRIVHHSCNKPSCPVCYKHGWAVRGAGKIEVRLEKASRHFGRVEHIVSSIPPKDYGLSFKALRSQAIKALKRRGVIGGVLIFHGFRYNVRKQWYWSPHFHCLGFILGGYRCRGCRETVSCLSCGGFEGRTRREYKKDGYIVKVFGKRKTVFGTAWYQLNHASIKKNTTRFHVATWFGACSYRKLKVTAELKKRVCPICQHDIVKLRYFGVNGTVLGCLFSHSSTCKQIEFFDDLVQDGRTVWVVDERRDF